MLHAELLDGHSVPHIHDFLVKLRAGKPIGHAHEKDVPCPQKGPYSARRVLEKNLHTTAIA